MVISMTLRRFNSIKVRLRLTATVNNALIPLFQFHKGSIKTITKCRVYLTDVCFNSIKVRLRRAEASLWPHG